MKRILFVALLAACATRPPVPESPIIVMDVSVADHLREVQQFFPREAAFCLLGNTVGHFVVVKSVQVARMLERSPTGVRFEHCEQRDFIGVAHNHPPGGGCAFSATDSLTFFNERRAIIDVVTADNRCMLVKMRNGRMVKVQ